MASTKLQKELKPSVRQRQSGDSPIVFLCVVKCIRINQRFRSSSCFYPPQNSDLALTELSCVPFKSPLVAPDIPVLSLQNNRIRVPRNFSAPNR